MCTRRGAIPLPRPKPIQQTLYSEMVRAAHPRQNQQKDFPVICKSLAVCNTPGSCGNTFRRNVHATKPDCQQKQTTKTKGSYQHDLLIRGTPNYQTRTRFPNYQNRNQRRNACVEVSLVVHHIPMRRRRTPPRLPPTKETMSNITSNCCNHSKTQLRRHKSRHLPRDPVEVAIIFNSAQRPHS